MNPDDATAGGRAAEDLSEGMEHLQQAARELISAARSFLDAAEELVDDRELLGEAGEMLRGFARDVSNSRARTGGHPFDSGGTGDVDPGPAAPDAAESQANSTPGRARTAGRETSARVRRIDVD